MACPNRDAAGHTIPYDDPEIESGDYLIRYAQPHDFAPCSNNERRLSKGLFSPSSKNRDPYQSMSADLLRLMLADGLSANGRMRECHIGVVKLKVGLLRELGLKVGRDPMPDNPYHVGVWGIKNTLRKKLLGIFEWVEKPDNVVP